MKKFKWKIWLITILVCLLPIMLGVAFWERLPENMAIHFNFYGEPDNYASKGFVVFGLPVLMALFQTFCCFITDTNPSKYNTSAKIVSVMKRFIPFIMVVLYVVTLGYGLGWSFDMRIVAGAIVAILLIVSGLCIPQLEYVKHYNLSATKAKKINRVVGIATIVMGALFLISVFLPPIWTAGCMVLLIPYTVICSIYGIVVGRKEK